MNGDEAMALGAAFRCAFGPPGNAASSPMGPHIQAHQPSLFPFLSRAANLSTAFRVRKVGVQDTSSFGVSVRLETLPGDAEEGGKEGGGLFGGLLGGKVVKCICPHLPQGIDVTYPSSPIRPPSPLGLPSPLHTHTNSISPLSHPAPPARRRTRKTTLQRAARTAPG